VLVLPFPLGMFIVDKPYRLLSHHLGHPIEEQQVVLRTALVQLMVQLPHVFLKLLQRFSFVLDCRNLISVALELSLVQSHPVLLKIIELVDVLRRIVLAAGLHMRQFFN
jgi:hypothetical protein